MNRETTINDAEKQRQRDSIAEQIRRYVENGGEITVLDAPAAHTVSPRGVSWIMDADLLTPDAADDS